MASANVPICKGQQNLEFALCYTWTKLHDKTTQKQVKVLHFKNL